MTPAVTWLLPTRNALPYLNETLESIATQTFRDFDVLAWDNGSTDGTVGVLNEWIPGRLPGCVVADEPKEVLSTCLARMVEESAAPLLARIDGDDRCHPARLEKQVAFMQANPGFAGIGSWCIRLDDQGRTGASIRHTPTDPDACAFELLFDCVLMHPTMLLRRDKVLAAGNYTPGVEANDYDLWVRLLLAGDLAAMGEPLLDYRFHGGNAHLKSKPRRAANNLAAVLGSLPRLLPGVDEAMFRRVWDCLSATSPNYRRRWPRRADCEAILRALCMARGKDFETVRAKKDFQYLSQNCHPRGAIYYRRAIGRALRRIFG